MTVEYDVVEVSDPWFEPGSRLWRTVGDDGVWVWHWEYKLTQVGRDEIAAILGRDL